MKVYCDVFTCGIRNTCSNQYNIFLLITIRTMFKGTRGGKSHRSEVVGVILNYCGTCWYFNSKTIYNDILPWGCKGLMWKHMTIIQLYWRKYWKLLWTPLVALIKILPVSLCFLQFSTSVAFYYQSVYSVWR